MTWWTRPEQRRRIRRKKRAQRGERLESRCLLAADPLFPAFQIGSEFLEVGNLTYFVADDGVHGHELWKTDGTPSGTELIRDIFEGESSAAPEELVKVGDAIYFTAREGSAARSIWTSDGTAGGTIKVNGIANLGGGGAAELTVVGDSVYFVADELYRIDTTTRATRMVKNINGNLSSFPKQLTNVDGTLYFTAYNNVSYLPPQGRELWKTDGTDAGTTLVKDIYPGTAAFGAPVSTNPQQLTGAGDLLFFYDTAELEPAALQRRTLGE